MHATSTKQFQVKQPIEKVWAFLSDLKKVASCLPGAQITEAIDDRTYKGTITVKVGPITSQFNGEVKIERLDNQIHEIELLGKGQDPRGSGGATMKMVGKLRSLTEGRTEVTGTTEITVTGRLAQFGSRMMDDVSNHVFEQFTRSFQAKLAQENGTGSEVAFAPTPQPVNALPLVLSVTGKVIGRFFGRILGKSTSS
ncbi:MAG: SRPBCC family protein [Ignavibacteriales bacterium]|nr:SRPBCC family protein [Ignavibacteriales bacterium]